MSTATSTTIHRAADCTPCASALEQAETMARVRGSVSATVTVDHRDVESGQVITDHGATWSR